MIQSSEYSSYNVRLSTFAKFPAIHGVDVHKIAASGFYYTGDQDIVRCYACDGVLMRWEPGDDPCVEHYKWFPDCPHLKQYNYKPQRRETNAEGSSSKFQEKPLASGGKESSSNVLAERLNELTFKKQNPKKQEVESDMTTPAALAVLEFGYSRNEVRVAIKVLRDKGQTALTADSILQVLISVEDKGIILPSHSCKENTKRNDIVSKSKEVSFQTLSSEEQLTECKSNKALTSEACKSNKALTSEAKDDEFCHILEENEKLTFQMICKRCRERQRNILVLPCTHFCLCEQCSKEVSLCPECWKPIKERVKTYVS